MQFNFIFPVADPENIFSSMQDRAKYASAIQYIGSTIQMLYSGTGDRKHLVTSEILAHNFI